MIPWHTAGEHYVGVQYGMRPVGEAEPAEPGKREQGRVRLAVFELAQPGLHVTPERHHFEIGADVTDQRSPAKRGGAHNRAFGEPGEPAGTGLRVGRDQRVAGIRARAGPRR